MPTFLLRPPAPRKRRRYTPMKGVGQGSPLSVSGVSATPTTTGVTLAATVSGGTGTVTVQWHRSATAGFTPAAGNALAGATTANHSDATAAAGTVYFYKLVATDQAPSSVTSSQVQAEPYRRALKVGFIGDSLYANTPTGGSKPSAHLATLAKNWGGYHYDVAVSDQSVSGSSTANSASGWHPLASSGYLTTAKSAFASAGVTHVVIRLGANDSIGSTSAAIYGTNLDAIVDDLVLAGYTVVLNYPTFAISGSYSGAPSVLAQEYQAQIDALANGSTVFVGVTHLFNYSATFASFAEADGIHPSAAGSQLMAEADVKALIDGVLYPTTGGGGLLAHPGMGGGMGG